MADHVPGVLETLRGTATALPRWVTFLVVLGAGVALSGFADFALTRAGYGNWAALVWAAGYAGTILVLWAGWVRPLDIVGSTEQDTD